MFTPMDDKHKPMNIEAFRKLPEETQNKIEGDIEKLHDSLRKIVHNFSILNREAQEQERKLKQETSGLCVVHLVSSDMRC